MSSVIFYSSEYGRWIRTSQPSCSMFRQRNMQSCIILMEDCVFSLDQFWMLFLKYCFHLVSLGAVLGINHLVFQKELIIEDSLLIPPCIQHHHLWMKTSLWCGWWVVHFACSTISSIPHDCTVSSFDCLSQFVLKTERFHRDLHAEIQWTYMEPKHQSD